MKRGQRSDERRAAAENGIALVVTMLVLVLVSVLMMGFVATIVTDQRAGGTDQRQTYAYAAAHAGLEKLTADLGDLFSADFSPSAAQVNGLPGAPTLKDVQFLAPDGTSGYKITFLPDGSGNPKPADPNGTAISTGPFEGFKGIITPYYMTVTARSLGSEVRLQRTLQTVAIPVFQFGIFSENDLSFFAGPDFNFGGRVHTNANLFLAQGDGATLVLADRSTAVGAVIRTNLSNGWLTSNQYTGNVNISTSPGTRNLARNEGSLVGTVGSAPNEAGSLWTNLSRTTYAGNIMSGTTGAKRLDLPLVSQGAEPIDLIRRAPATELVTSPVFQQRFFSQAGIRILLSDTAAEITGLPTVTATAPVPLINATIGSVKLAVSDGPLGNPLTVYRSSAGQPLIGGFIKIERRDAGGTWLDVTADVLALGIAGRNLSNGNWNNPGNACTAEPQPNAVIRLQRVRDVPQWQAPCGINGGGQMNGQGTDFWPLALYDTREGNLRDSNADSDTTLYLGGIMHYIELDVNNLRRYLAGTIGASGSTTRSDNGYIVYFSDRRNNKNTAAVETGEYGFEDVVNPADINGVPNGVLDPGEDLNTPKTNPVTPPSLQVYGRLGVNQLTGALDPFINGKFSTAPITGLNTASVARANRPVHFRRALKLVNGGGTPIMPGLTIAAENPIYVQGNYNSDPTSTTTKAHGAYAVIGDAVTLLSNNWNDIRSFTSPNKPGDRSATETGYRMAIIGGKPVSFPRPTSWATAADQDFGTDGGAHNFLRYIESWSGQSLNYRGSIISFYTSRQAVGTYKCCTNVYSPPDRGYNFDTEFLTPSLLPPGTPMFRDINTLTFRQLFRPNQ